MNAAIHIAPELILPLDLVTQAIGILAKRRSGKSYTAAKVVEQLLDARQQVVIADPKGDWWGLRSSADGKGPGFPILILGGEHGDLPLEPSAGELIAQLVVEEELSILLDLSMFHRSERTQFMTAFLEKLYLLKAQERYRTAMLLVIDEADTICPQKPRRGEERMLDAADDIVRRGGQRGLGCMMVTQRSSVINKNVLTQIEVLVALRTSAPQDLSAIGDWIDNHGTPEQRKELMNSLPSLPVGTAWFWSPGWPTHDGIFARVQVAPRVTFDSGATPKAGERREAPRSLADVDLGGLRERMAATIERVLADDPRALRKRIAELERQAQQFHQGAPAPTVERVVEQVTVPVLLESDLAAAQTLVERVEHMGQGLRQQAEAMFQQAEAMLQQAEAMQGRLDEVVSEQRAAIAALQDSTHEQSLVVAVPHSTRLVPAPTITVSDSPALAIPASDPPALDMTEVKLNLPARKILTVLAQHGPRTKAQLAILTRYSGGGGAFNTALSALRTSGYISGGGKEMFHITEAGTAALGSWDALPTGEALVAWWQEHLDTKAERVIFKIVVDAGRPLSKQEVADQAGYEMRGGSFNTALSRLRTLQLIEGSSEELTANPELLAA